jgi:hypothetical protein
MAEDSIENLLLLDERGKLVITWLLPMDSHTPGALVTLGYYLVITDGVQTSNQ